MPFDPLSQPAGLARRERLVERGGVVGIQIVLDQHDQFGIREDVVAKEADGMGIVDRRARGCF